MEEPFKLEEIEDVRIIIKARGKNWALTPNKENAEKEDVDPKSLRIAILGAILKLHDIVTPALEDIKSERASADTLHENSGLNIADVTGSASKSDETIHYEALKDCCNNLLDEVEKGNTPRRQLTGLKLLLNR